MKIEIELDDERLRREVVEAVSARVKADMLAEVTELVRQEVSTTLRAHIQTLCKELLTEDLRIKDMTLREYVLSVLQRRDNNYNDTLRIHSIVENQAYHEALRIFNEEIAKQSPVLRRRIVEQLLNWVLNPKE